VLVGAGRVMLAALVITIVAWVVIQGPVTVYRIARYGDTTIDDYAHYPFRALVPSPRPHRFELMPQPGPGLDKLSVANLGDVDLGAMLEQSETIAFLVLKDQRLVYERYLRGHGEAKVSQVFSVAKSVLSVLIGAAVEDRIIASVDDPVTRYVPELAAGGFDKVRIVDLLTMSSAMDYVEDDNPFGRHVRFNFTPNLEREILALRVKPAREARFAYKSGESALLALVLTRALNGRSITQYTQARRWSPLGMEQAGLWSLDREGGLEKTWCCLGATARDLVKIGALYRDAGQWRGQALVSRQWVHESTRSGPHAGDRWPRDGLGQVFWNYGYQWWLIDRARGDFAALGKDGQFIYVDPGRGVVIVRLGHDLGRYGERPLRIRDWIALFQALSDRSAVQ
jgi:CubicO group peptidase (beta-lactamase class C family)